MEIEQGLEVVGSVVTPHVGVTTMQFRQPLIPPVGGLVRLFVRSRLPFGRRNLCIDEATGREHIGTGAWSWFDFPDDAPDANTQVAPGQLTVLTMNYLQPVPKKLALSLSEDGPFVDVALDPKPRVWLTAVTFLGSSVQPDRIVVHVANSSDTELRIEGLTLYVNGRPASITSIIVNEGTSALHEERHVKIKPVVVPAHDFGVIDASVGTLPLSQAVVEVRLRGRKSLWAHVRVKRESFDISGGWVGEKYLTDEPYLKALKGIHINTAHIPLWPGYSDTALAQKYPLKHFHGCQPLERYDNETILPRVHAIEFLGEPQYGGRKGPTPPQDVWKALAPFALSRLATTVTWSDPRTWYRYAGISDYPHYDAYRVCAPATDNWRRYSWPGGQSITWGAPLETIGEMCRTLRELYRPAPTAYWSQGPHDDWAGWRPRATPTPDELRLQAYHALASRITSLYWFNIKPASWAKFRDTYEPMKRLGREMRLLEPYLLEGAATHWEKTKERWELSVIASLGGAAIFALDNAYTPDPEKKVFVFGAPRPSVFAFPLPRYAQKPSEVVRLDAEGAHAVTWKATKAGVEIRDTQSKVAVYITSPTKGLAERLEKRRQALLAEEARYDFDPGARDSDYETLKRIAAR